MRKHKVEIPIELQEMFKHYQKERILYSNRMDIDGQTCNVKYSLSCDDVTCEHAHVEQIKMAELEKTFQELLFEYIDRTELTDSEVYKKAYIDRRLFSKIKADKDYRPSFGTITLFALALKLSIEEYEELLKTSSYSLSDSSRGDITLRYCFNNKIYNIIEVNNLVFTVTGKEIKELHN